ncbi:hypothetical protein AKJ16_DCAP21053 [Drosera capensis]
MPKPVPIIPSPRHLVPSLHRPISSTRPDPPNPTLTLAQNTQMTNPQTQLPSSSNYPIPLSPPLPLISKDIELRRAMTASSRSGLWSIGRGDVVFEDEWLVVVNKKAGVYCERVLGSVVESRGEGFGSYGNPALPPEFHLANRLDRDTSGVLVITKSHKVAAKLVQAFTDHKVQKTYVALCVGTAPMWDKLRLRSGHGRSKHGVWRVYAASDVGRMLPNGSTVKNMETCFEVVRVNGQGKFKKMSGCPEDEEKVIFAEEKCEIRAREMKDEILVRAFPRSGKTHQIRLHCQYLGMPIKGDVKYEGIHEWEGKICEGHCLHAESLAFEHPVTHLPLLIEAPLPSWVSEAFEP